MICSGVYPFLATYPSSRDYNWYRFRGSGQLPGVEIPVKNGTIIDSIFDLTIEQIDKCSDLFVSMAV